MLCSIIFCVSAKSVKPQTTAFDYSQPNAYTGVLHDYSSLKAVDYVFTQGSKSLDKNSATQNYNINIFPNPASDIVNIVLPDLKNKEIVDVEAFDVIGKSVTITNKEYTDNVYMLNFSNISEGVYLIHVCIGDKTTIKKITIVK